MAGGNAAAWTVTSCVRAYQAAWAERAAAPAFELGLFRIRIQSVADLLARDPWRILSWENPFARSGPAAPFWDRADAGCQSAFSIDPQLEWAPEVGQFQAADLTGLRGCSSSKRLGLR